MAKKKVSKRSKRALGSETGKAKRSVKTKVVRKKTQKKKVRPTQRTVANGGKGTKYAYEGDAAETKTPVSLTPKKRKTLLQAIRDGNYQSVALKIAGVGATNYRKWLESGRAQFLRGENTDLSKFFCEVRDAEAQAELLVVKHWKKHMPKHWQACATYLERRHPERWARIERIRVTEDNEDQDKTIPVSLTLDDDGPSLANTNDGAAVLEPGENGGNGHADDL